MPLAGNRRRTAALPPIISPMVDVRTVPRIDACPVCFKLFEHAIGRGAIRKYCSPACVGRSRRTKWNLKRQSHWQSKTCEWCFKEWQPKHKMTARFCSQKCVSHYFTQLERFGVSDHSVLPVCVCGNLACPDPYKKNRVSQGKHRQCLDCRKVQFRERDAGRGNHKAKSRREIVKAGETIKFDDLLMRDGPLCQICGDHMDWQTGRHRERVSLDHIMPISKGGSHTMNNVRLVHMGCNSKRGNRSAHELCRDQ